MKKAKLDLNDLRVESWDTTFDAAAAEGNILGQSDTYTPTNCTTYHYCDSTQTGNLCGGTSVACPHRSTDCAYLCQD